MSIRQSEKHVVFNSKSKEKWKTEEIVDEMPFNEGKDFSMAVCAQARYFEIGINSEFFKRFEIKSGQKEKPEQLSVQLRQVAHVKKIAYHP